MRDGILTCVEPKDPESIYMRNMFHTFFWGPFKDEQAVIGAIKILDETDPCWDYNPFCIIYGANPLPDDFVNGFPFVDDSMVKRIMELRKEV